jgi:hypothetical protein
MIRDYLVILTFFGSGSATLILMCVLKKNNEIFHFYFVVQFIPSKQYPEKPRAVVRPYDSNHQQPENVWQQRQQQQQQPAAGWWRGAGRGGAEPVVPQQQRGRGGRGGAEPPQPPSADTLPMPFMQVRYRYREAVSRVCWVVQHGSLIFN